MSLNDEGALNGSLSAASQKWSFTMGDYAYDSVVGIRGRFEEPR